MGDTDKTTDSTDAAAPPGRGRREHLALVDATSGKAGSPTPSERQAIYLATLRRGPLPRGWVVSKAKEWGLSTPTLSEEIKVARAELEQSRQAPAAKAQAHELIVQAAELADTIKRLAAAPLKPDPGEAPEATVARAKGLEVRCKLLGLSPGLKLKAAAELRQLHGLKPADGAGGYGGGYPPQTDIGAALTGGPGGRPSAGP